MRLAYSNSHVRVFAAVSADHGLPALVLDFTSTVRPPRFDEVATRAFRMAAPAVTGLAPERWAIVISLEEPLFRDHFATLAENVLTAVQGANTDRTAVDRVVRCVALWRRFAERKPEPLSAAEVRGLIGELVVLCRCVRSLNAETALAAWTGPDRALRDFELPDASIEVKTFQGTDAGKVLIASPDQLDCIEPRPVYLAAVSLTPSETHGMLLADFVASAVDIVGRDSPHSLLLEDRLATAGYLASHATLYSTRFVAGPVSLFAVTADFPRVRPSDVPHGVVDVTFALRLAILAPFRVAAERVLGDRVPEMGEA